jgi:CHASE2 domain-containing sensor protein
MLSRKGIPGWLIGLILTLLFIAMFVTGFADFTDVIEKKTFDIRSKISASAERCPDIELVVINDEDLAEIGRFPWPRSIIAQGVNNLAIAGAKVIALDIMFNEPEQSAGLNTIRELNKIWSELSLPDKDTTAATFSELLKTAEANLDHDARLVEAVEKAGNVILPVYFDTRATGRDQDTPDYIAKNAFKVIHGLKDDWSMRSIMWHPKMIPLLPSFAHAAAGIGHINLFPDSDGSIRSQTHAIARFPLQS